MKKYTISHADTCLPDYWPGHHLPHISFPPSRNMTMEAIKSALHSELNEGAIGGSSYEESEENFKAMSDAINALEPNDPNQKEFFQNLEEPEEDSDCYPYAYFVFVPCDE